MKELYQKYREVILYLVFGVITTAVSFGAYFAVIALWKAAFDLPVDDQTSPTYLIGDVIAATIQWITGVLVAFFTNRQWVFTDADKSTSVWKQLMTFSAGRVATLGLEYVVTLGCRTALGAIFPSWLAYPIPAMGLPAALAAKLPTEINLAQLFAKFISGVIVVITNYVLSKLFVFKKKK